MSEIDRTQDPGELQLDLPAAHSAGRMARQMVKEFAGTEGLPDDEQNTLEFVAGELIDNAVDHGGGGGAREVADLKGDVRMHLHLSIHGGEWSLTVEDEGAGDPKVIQDMIHPPDGFPDLEDERGRGFFLMNGMVDGMSVDRGAKGLVIRATHRYA